jgi:hypothetical protein
MMEFLQELGRKLRHAFAVTTDWLLILLGGWLLLTAIVRIDVQLARYLILLIGVALTGCGLWFRWRRLRRQRIMGEAE